MGLFWLFLFLCVFGVFFNIVFLWYGVFFSCIFCWRLFLVGYLALVVGLVVGILGFGVFGCWVGEQEKARARPVAVSKIS